MIALGSRTVSLLFVAAGLLSGAATTPGVRITRQSKRSTTIEFTAGPVSVDQVRLGGQAFQAVTVDGCNSGSSDLGKPQVPMAQLTLAVPNGATVSVRVLEVESETLDVPNVAPLQPETSGEKSGQPVALDEESCRRDELYPNRIVDVAHPAVWRDLQVATVRVCPVQVNPARGVVTVAKKVTARLEYSGGAYPKSVAAWMMPIYARVLDNSGALRLLPTNGPDDAVRYLVFRHSHYAQNEWLNESLVGWNNRRGYRARVIEADGMSCDEIEDTIRHYYGEPNQPPLGLRFVLLVGDVEEVPTKRGYWGSGWDDSVKLSDHWYSEVMRLMPADTEAYGVDMWPDVGVGRLAPRNSDTAGLSQQIAKIVNYEKRPDTTCDWLNKMLMVNYFNTNSRFENLLDDIAAGPFYNYYAPTRSRISGRDKSNNDVRDSVNSGAGILLYAGHGQFFCWPEWNRDGESWGAGNVNALDNWPWTPVVFTVACSTSAFDRDGEDCLSEAWMRHGGWDSGGAVASYGATQNSSNDPNLLQCSTIVRALCDTTLRVQGPTRNYDAPVHLLGDVDMVVDAKIASRWANTANSQNIFMYMFFGDPAMPIWTGGVPRPAEVSYPDTIECGPCPFTIQVNVTDSNGTRPVEGALVCLSRDSDIYLTGRTDNNGYAKIVVVAETAGSIHVTVSEGHAAGEKPHTPIIPFQGETYVKRCWHEVASMPRNPSSKPVKDGGWLAYNAGNGRIYGAKGNNRGDFYEYLPTADTWRQLPSMLPGVEGKLPRKGSIGCCDGDSYIYATKGNNTQGFWRFTVGGFWAQKAPVPLGPSNKRVKGGTSIVWAYKAETGYPYLLKGYKNEFYRYHVVGDSWHRLPDAPVGGNIKWDKGSWLAYDGDSFIYACKAKYHEFYRYDVQRDTWDRALRSIPVSGSGGRKKMKDGGCGAFMDGYIYALKGANSQEFWRYRVSANSWVEKETVPRYGSSNMTRRVRYGGSLVSTGRMLFALKGNKCRECWCYVPDQTDGGGLAGFLSTSPGRGRDSASETPISDGIEGHMPRWDPVPTSGMVVYSKEDTLTGYEAVYQRFYGSSIPEERVTDVATDCEEPVVSNDRPSGQLIAFQFMDTLSDCYQIAVTPAYADGGDGGSGGADKALDEASVSADATSGFSAAKVVLPVKSLGCSPRSGAVPIGGTLLSRPI